MKYEIPQEFKPFVANVRRRCKINGVELMMAPSKTVVVTDSFSTDCSGYFDEADKVLAVACGKPFEEWIVYSYTSTAICNNGYQTIDGISGHGAAKNYGLGWIRRRL